MLQTLKKIEFPSVDQADDQGFLCHGGLIDVPHVLNAYLQGIFPWPSSDLPTPLWFAPDPRGIIELSEFTIAKSFAKWRKKNLFHVTFNQNFSQVINLCRKCHTDGVWITPEMIATYTELFNLHHAYSVECWKEKQLVGGLYGVCLGNFFSAESMFFLESNASKLALVSLVERLKSAHVRWIDTQMVSSIVENFGGQYISRLEFMKRLNNCNFAPKREDFFKN